MGPVVGNVPLDSGRIFLEPSDAVGVGGKGHGPSRLRVDSGDVFDHNADSDVHAVYVSLRCSRLLSFAASTGIHVCQLEGGVDTQYRELCFKLCGSWTPAAVTSTSRTAVTRHG